MHISACAARQRAEAAEMTKRLAEVILLCRLPSVLFESIITQNPHGDPNTCHYPRIPRAPPERCGGRKRSGYTRARMRTSPIDHKKINRLQRNCSIYFRDRLPPKRAMALLRAVPRGDRRGGCGGSNSSSYCSSRSSSSSSSYSSSIDTSSTGARTPQAAPCGPGRGRVGTTESCVFVG